MRRGREEEGKREGVMEELNEMSLIAMQAAEWCLGGVW